MVITSKDDMTLDYLPCQYGKSKLLVRGPQRPLTGPCCAIPGGPALAAALSRVDFTGFHFNRHMLQALYAVDPRRFVPLADELRIAWVARTAEMIRRLPGPVVLLWTASHAPLAPGATADPPVSPVLVDSGMIQSLRGLVAHHVEVVSSSKARAKGVSGMIYTPLYQGAASERPGPAVHREIAAALADRLRPFL